MRSKYTHTLNLVRSLVENIQLGLNLHLSPAVKEGTEEGIQNIILGVQNIPRSTKTVS